MRAVSHVAWQRIGDEVVIVDLATRKAIGLNPAGALIWSLLGGASQVEMAHAVAARFGIARECAAADVGAFLDDLAARGLIEEATPCSP